MTLRIFLQQRRSQIQGVVTACGQATFSAFDSLHYRIPSREGQVCPSPMELSQTLSGRDARNPVDQVEQGNWLVLARRLRNGRLNGKRGVVTQMRQIGWGEVLVIDRHPGGRPFSIL